MTTSAKWADLLPRLLSAVVMIAVGGYAVFAGGLVFQLLVSVLAGLMVWELVRMMGPKEANLAHWLGLLAAAVIFGVDYLPVQAQLPVLLAPVLAGLSAFSKGRWIWCLYMPVILLGCYAALWLRNDYGLFWVLWLAGLVIVSDVAGYFAGRLLGGPKFWPRVSPKKTWSGTVAGWIGAALLGWWFVANSAATAMLIPISVLVAFGGQMGDIGESAIKRKLGIKDSSNLIPGHGGFLDRFDAMIGALLLVLLTSLFVSFLPGMQ